MGIMKPLPSVTQSIVDTNGKPTKDFYNWLKTIQGAGGGGSSGSILAVPATTFFVSASGNDTTGDGLTTGTAWATIQKAIDVIYTYNWGGQVITLDVGAGSFANFAIIGLGIGSAGSSGVDQTGIVLVGAGSGSTTIAAGSVLRGARLNLSAVTVDCTAAANAFDGDAASNLVLASDVIFSGNSASAIALSFNQFSSVIQDGNVSLAGTIGAYFLGFASANYEQNSGALTVNSGATVSTLLTLDTLSNYHFFGGSIVVSGTTNSNAYVASGGSIVAGFGGVAIDTLWTAGGGEAGILASGARGEDAVSAATVTSSGGTVALTTGSNAYSAVATLTVTGGTPTTGTVSITELRQQQV